MSTQNKQDTLSSSTILEEVSFGEKIEQMRSEAYEVRDNLFDKYKNDESKKKLLEKEFDEILIAYDNLKKLEREKTTDDLNYLKKEIDDLKNLDNFNLADFRDAQKMLGKIEGLGAKIEKKAKNSNTHSEIISSYLSHAKQLASTKEAFSTKYTSEITITQLAGIINTLQSGNYLSEFSKNVISKEKKEAKLLAYETDDDFSSNIDDSLDYDKSSDSNWFSEIKDFFTEEREENTPHKLSDSSWFDEVTDDISTTVNNITSEYSTKAKIIYEEALLGKKSFLAYNDEKGNYSVSLNEIEHQLKTVNHIKDVNAEAFANYLEWLYEEKNNGDTDNFINDLKNNFGEGEKGTNKITQFMSLIGSSGSLTMQKLEKNNSKIINILLNNREKFISNNKIKEYSKNEFIFENLCAIPERPEEKAMRWMGLGKAKNFTQDAFSCFIIKKETYNSEISNFSDDLFSAHSKAKQSFTKALKTKKQILLFQTNINAETGQDKEKELEKTKKQIKTLENMSDEEFKNFSAQQGNLNNISSIIDFVEYIEQEKEKQKKIKQEDDIFQNINNENYNQENENTKLNKYFSKHISDKKLSELGVEAIKMPDGKIKVEIDNLDTPEIFNEEGEALDYINLISNLNECHLGLFIPYLGVIQERCFLKAQAINLKDGINETDEKMIFIIIEMMLGLENKIETNQNGMDRTINRFKALSPLEINSRAKENKIMTESGFITELLINEWFGNKENLNKINTIKLTVGD